jgi:hypothetical protein
MALSAAVPAGGVRFGSRWSIVGRVGAGGW